MTPAKPLPGQRQTRQRALVHEVLRAAQGPLTVQDIHSRVQQEMPQTGVATVYRTVKLLLEAGWIKSVNMPTGETRYESSGLGHHHHFHCRNCDQVFDVDHCPMSLPVGSSLPGGYVLDAHEITFYGSCPSCIHLRHES